MSRDEFQELMNRIFLLWPRVKTYLDTASPDPAGTLRAWSDRVSDFDLSLALAMTTKMNSGKLESIGPYPSDCEYVCDLIARHCRAALDRNRRQEENEQVIEAGTKPKLNTMLKVKQSAKSSQALRAQTAWYRELFDFYNVPDDGRNRMMLADEMGVRDKILCEVKNRLEEFMGAS